MVDKNNLTRFGRTMAQRRIGMIPAYSPRPGPSEQAFWTARRGFYRGMLNKPAIFATRYFRDRFEAQARANLRRAAEA